MSRTRQKQSPGEACNFIKKETQAPPVSLAKFVNTPFLIEHLRWLPLAFQVNLHSIVQNFLPETGAISEV